MCMVIYFGEEAKEINSAHPLTVEINSCTKLIS